ncbi:MAG TPA: hypothetical protein VFQ34_11690 [Nitrospiraceae bacterium]|nr:hypothetical protein [Nitrospiraceae bacterium]
MRIASQQGEMEPTTYGTRDALFYPFHLCAPATLQAMLTRFHRIHFRDYMALRLTPMMGTTAYQDRMGDSHPDLVRSGRIIQGHGVSGVLSSDAVGFVDRALADQGWRSRFHKSLAEDRRFQRGLFDLTHAMRLGSSTVPGPAALLRLLEPTFSTHPYNVDSLRRQSRPGSLEDAYAFEYGLALLKTAAAEYYTVQLSRNQSLVAVTDSLSHYELFDRTLIRESLPIEHEHVSPGDF